MRYSERMIMLQLLDSQWKDHLLSMDHLKEGIGLRGYGQKDPLVEYKKESFQLFQDMMARFDEETIRILYSLQPSVAASRGPPTPGGGDAVRAPTRKSRFPWEWRPAGEIRSKSLRAMSAARRSANWLTFKWLGREEGRR